MLRVPRGKHSTGQATIGKNQLGKPGLEEYPVRYYEEFLEYVKERYEGQYWHVLPREMARYWRENVKGFRDWGIHRGDAECAE